VTCTRSWGLTAIIAAVAVGASCQDGARSPERPLTLSLLQLGPEPLLQIGVVEGDPDYELHEAASSVRFPDGRIVVANAGTEVLCFNDRGRLVWKSGRQGSGPGEFRRLSRLYRYGRDSILALDRGLNRASVLGANGAFAHLVDPITISRDSAFPMDVWLHGRFWVDGALRPDGRRAVRNILDRLPPPRSAPGYRFVQVDALGNVWIREPLRTDDQVWHWTVVDESGRPVNAIELPLRFEPHHIDRDLIVGRWRDENGVNFIRMYGFHDSGMTRQAPAWMTADVAAEPAIPTEQTDEMLALLKTSLRDVVMAQETYFMSHGRYTLDSRDLTWDVPDGVSLDIIAGTATGWSAVATHRDIEKICGMAVGSATPPGWQEGSARCG